MLTNTETCTRHFGVKDIRICTCLKEATDNIMQFIAKAVARIGIPFKLNTMKLMAG